MGGAGCGVLRMCLASHLREASGHRARMDAVPKVTKRRGGAPRGDAPRRQASQTCTLSAPVAEEPEVNQAWLRRDTTICAFRRFAPSHFSGATPRPPMWGADSRTLARNAARR